MTFCDNSASIDYVSPTSPVPNYPGPVEIPPHPFTQIIFSNFNLNHGFTVCSLTNCSRWDFGWDDWVSLPFSPLYQYHKGAMVEHDGMIWITGGLDYGASGASRK